MNYEIQIFAKDRSKIIRFAENADEMTSIRKQLAWEDLYYAIGAVVERKADRFRENDTLIGRINVQDLPYEQVLDIMCEDLPGKYARLLTHEQEVMVLEEVN